MLDACRSSRRAVDLRIRLRSVEMPLRERPSPALCSVNDVQAVPDAIGSTIARTGYQSCTSFSIVRAAPVRLSSASNSTCRFRSEIDASIFSFRLSASSISLS